MTAGYTQGFYEKPPIYRSRSEGEREDDAYAWQRAYEDALKALRSIADPALFAASIDEHHREALRSAWRCRDGWRVGPERLRELRLLGLAEVGGEGGHAHERNHLTAFGMAVRRVAMALDDAEGDS